MRVKNLIWVMLLTTLLAAGCVPTEPKGDQDKQQAIVHYKLGASHLQVNNPTLALKELLIAVSKDPQNSSIQAALAQAYQMKKAYRQAEQHYLKALELSDNDPRFQNNLASLYLDMQEWDKAIAYFDKAASNLLFLSPHVAITGKAYAFFRKGDLDLAQLYYQEAISIAPGYSRAHYLLSELYHERGQDALEKRSLERALELSPEFVEAHYQLGVLLLKEEQVDEAAAQFRIVQELAADNDWGQKAVDMLKALPDR